MAVTVLIVDDHNVFRAAARRLLESAGVEVVGEAGDLKSGRAAIRALRPQVVLLDVQLPDGDGIEEAEAICAEDADRSVVLVSNRDAGEYGDRLRTSAARGFLRKDELSVSRLFELLGI